MKTKKRLITIVGVLLLISVVVSICSCSKSATVQIDDLYKLETKEDVINYLGKPDPKIQNSEKYDLYRVRFMDEVFLLVVFYRDGEITDLSMEYNFGEILIENFQAPENYSVKDIQRARNLVKAMVDSFTAKYGEGEIKPTEVNTVIYEWNVDGYKLKVVDCINAPDFWCFEVISVSVK